VEIKVKEILSQETEYIEIGCHRRDSRVEEIIRFVKLHQGTIEATKQEKQYQIPLSEIYYIEAVDDKTFIYLSKSCYESHKRLYEFEELLADRSFARISKSVVVNLMKITSIKPALNGRFLCQLKNNENVIISRKYVAEIKERLRG
jgi:DNA-binding LytR/AlgR family response regulator